MLFNSIEFAIFLPAVFLLYWFATGGDRKWQNAVLLAASYLFYGWWDWRFLSLIVLSTAIDYTVGLRMVSARNAGSRKLLLGISIATNLGLLGFFKYYNFFIGSLEGAFTFFGSNFNPRYLDIVLPVGISFYTFQTLSYTIDIYRGKLTPVRDPVAFAAFVAFFPQLVAGPIERAGNLVPQFANDRRFDLSKATDGLRQMLWGLFKKVVMADNCAVFVNIIFADPDAHGGSTLLVGAVLFAFQIYGDFSGYSDIAIGAARLFGFNLMQNFAFPYFSRDIAEFWRRWHISLSTWFRDYLYIPLGGSRGGTSRKVFNTFAIFLVSGLWHGADWTFVAWGGLNALYCLPLLLAGANRSNLGTVAQGRLFPAFREVLAMSFTFLLTVVAWVFFRADGMGQALAYLSGMADVSMFTVPLYKPLVAVVPVSICLGLEWLARDRQHALAADWLTSMARPLRWAFYAMIILAVLWFNDRPMEFIYFQF
jgi:alginate O-acetyltransferase complex protein AlgI